jgi:hypothetical protein
LGANQITIAPRFVYDSNIGEEKFNLDLIVPIENGSTGNYLVEGFSTEPDGLNDPYSYREVCGNSDWYAVGLTSDYYNNPLSNGADSGKIWGWGTGHGLWTNDPSFSCIESVAMGFTSAAVFNAAAAPPPTNVWATSSSTTTCTSMTPAGQCIEQGTFTGSGYTFVGDGLGAELIVFDSITGDIYALSESNRVWKNWNELPNARCTGGGVVVPVQIAAKNGVVFALGETGTVWFLGGVDGSTCWTPINITEDFTFTAIATDNDFFLGPAVWGVDYAGYLWAAQ